MFKKPNVICVYFQNLGLILSMLWHKQKLKNHCLRYCRYPFQKVNIFSHMKISISYSLRFYSYGSAGYWFSFFFLFLIWASFRRIFLFFINDQLFQVFSIKQNWCIFQRKKSIDYCCENINKEKKRILHNTHYKFSNFIRKLLL